jgi:hypothetical protein
MNKRNHFQMIMGTALFFLILIPIHDASAFRPGRPGTMTPSSSELGLRPGYDFDIDAWSFGAQLRLALGPGGRIQIIPSGDLYFFDGNTDWQINVDAALRDRGAMYFGGGLAITNRDFTGTGDEDTKYGGNLLAGLKIRMRRSPVRPYIEGRWTFIEEENPFRLVVGLNFLLKGRPGR